MSRRYSFARFLADDVPPTVAESLNGMAAAGQAVSAWLQKKDEADPASVYRQVGPDGASGEPEQGRRGHDNTSDLLYAPLQTRGEQMGSAKEGHRQPGEAGVCAKSGQRASNRSRTSGRVR